MKDKIRIAAVQMDPMIMRNNANLESMLRQADAAARTGADLIVFPECALSGYVFNSREEAIPYMETVPGPSTDKLAAFCKEHDAHIVAGLLEIDGDRCFNAAVLVGPQGLVGKYRKNHLPFLGIDRFVDRGDMPFSVYSTPVGNIGIHICYDGSFPESARVMALLGADILVLPTNFPTRAGASESKMVQYIINARAFENRVHYIAVDRVGTERGVLFEGRSKIVNARGDTLVQASSDKEETLYGEVSLAEARQKHVVIKPGEFELDCIADRRPELYGELTKKRRLTPGVRKSA